MPCAVNLGDLTTTVSRNSVYSLWANLSAGRQRPPGQSLEESHRLYEAIVYYI
jgi:hypothetical protein